MRLALLLSLVPALAFGQTAPLTVKIQNQSSATVNAGSCGIDVRAQWTAQVIGLPCSPLNVWATTGDCSAGPDAGVLIGSVPQSSWQSQGSGTLTKALNDLPLFDGGTCGDAVDVTANICAQYSYSSFSDCLIGSTPVPATPATLRYDAVNPAKPTITAVNALDSALSVRISPPDGAIEVALEYRPKGATTFLPGPTYSADQGGTTIDGLTNGTVYEIRARVTDEANNQGAFSELATGTPEPTAGFWANYLGDGGKETGGCAVGGGGLLGLLLLAGLSLRGRRNR